MCRSPSLPHKNLRAQRARLVRHEPCGAPRRPASPSAQLPRERRQLAQALLRLAVADRGAHEPISSCSVSCGGMLSKAYTHAASTSSCSAGVHATSVSYSPLEPAGAPGNFAALLGVALLALKTTVASSGGTIGRPADAGAAAVSNAKPPPRTSVG